MPPAWNEARLELLRALAQSRLRELSRTFTRGVEAAEHVDKPFARGVESRPDAPLGEPIRSPRRFASARARRYRRTLDTFLRARAGASARSSSLKCLVGWNVSAWAPRFRTSVAIPSFARSGSTTTRAETTPIEPVIHVGLGNDRVSRGGHVIASARGDVGEARDERFLGGELLELVMNTVGSERATPGGIDVEDHRRDALVRPRVPNSRDDTVVRRPCLEDLRLRSDRTMNTHDTDRRRQPERQEVRRAHRAGVAGARRRSARALRPSLAAPGARPRTPRRRRSPPKQPPRPDTGRRRLTRARARVSIFRPFASALTIAS